MAWRLPAEMGPRNLARALSMEAVMTGPPQMQFFDVKSYIGSKFRSSADHPIAPVRIGHADQDTGGREFGLWSP